MENYRIINMSLIKKFIKNYKGKTCCEEFVGSKKSIKVVIDKENRIAVCCGEKSEKMNINNFSSYVATIGKCKPVVLKELEIICEEYGIKKVFAKKGKFLERNEKYLEIIKRIELMDLRWGCDIEDLDVEEAYEYIDMLFREECGEYDGPAEFEDFMQDLRKKVGLFRVPIVDVRSWD